MIPCDSVRSLHFSVDSMTTHTSANWPRRPRISRRPYTHSNTILFGVTDYFGPTQQTEKLRQHCQGTASSAPCLLRLLCSTIGYVDPYLVTPRHRRRDPPACTPAGVPAAWILAPRDPYPGPLAPSGRRLGYLRMVRLLRIYSTIFI